MPLPSAAIPSVATAAVMPAAAAAHLAATLGASAGGVHEAEEAETQRHELGVSVGWEGCPAGLGEDGFELQWLTTDQDVGVLWLHHQRRLDCDTSLLGSHTADLTLPLACAYTYRPCGFSQLSLAVFVPSLAW